MAKKVAILGCGPAGLLAAHAAALNGCTFEIFSHKQKSQLFGAQYLHQEIPGLHLDPTFVTYELRGTVEDYRKKVYQDWKGTVSPEVLAGEHYAWDIRWAYKQLWREYHSMINDINITGVEAVRLNTSIQGFDLVLSTLPRKLWREPGDQFISQKIWAIGDAPEIGRPIPERYRGFKDYTVICNGEQNPAWYRASRIFGYTTVEWPEKTKPPIRGVVLVEKPIGHTSTAASDFVHLGRYGKWQKGVLTTDAFNEALKVTA